MVATSSLLTTTAKEARSMSTAIISLRSTCKLSAPMSTSRTPSRMPIRKMTKPRRGPWLRGRLQPARTALGSPAVWSLVQRALGIGYGFRRIRRIWPLAGHGRQRQIAAFNPVDGRFIGLMRKPDDSILTIEGLWTLGFGAGNAYSGPYNTLFFTAGPNDEGDGTFGTLVPVAAKLNEVDEP
jgi:hypothetical protein